MDMAPQERDPAVVEDSVHNDGSSFLCDPLLEGEPDDVLTTAVKMEPAGAAPSESDGKERESPGFSNTSASGSPREKTSTPENDDEKGEDDKHNKYCHFCQHVKLRASSMLACENKGCARRFCEHCLSTQLGDDLDKAKSTAWKDGVWHCPVCRKMCCCALTDCTSNHRHCKAYRYRRRRAEIAAKRQSADKGESGHTPAIDADGYGRDGYGYMGMHGYDCRVVPNQYTMGMGVTHHMQHDMYRPPMRGMGGMRNPLYYGQPGMPMDGYQGSRGYPTFNHVHGMMHLQQAEYGGGVQRPGLGEPRFMQSTIVSQGQLFHHGAGSGMNSIYGSRGSAPVHSQGEMGLCSDKPEGMPHYSPGQDPYGHMNEQRQGISPNPMMASQHDGPPMDGVRPDVHHAQTGPQMHSTRPVADMQQQRGRISTTTPAEMSPEQQMQHMHMQMQMEINKMSQRDSPGSSVDGRMGSMSGSQKSLSRQHSPDTLGPMPQQVKSRTDGWFDVLDDESSTGNDGVKILERCNSFADKFSTLGLELPPNEILQKPRMMPGQGMNAVAHSPSGLSNAQGGEYRVKSESGGMEAPQSNGIGYGSGPRPMHPIDPALTQVQAGTLMSSLIVDGLKGKRLNRTDSHEQLSNYTSGRVNESNLTIAKGRRYGGSSENLRRLTTGMSPSPSYSELAAAMSRERTPKPSDFSVNTTLQRSDSNSSMGLGSSLLGMDDFLALPGTPKGRRDSNLVEPVAEGTEVNHIEHNAGGLSQSQSMNSMSGALLDFEGLTGLSNVNSENDLLSLDLGGASMWNDCHDNGISFGQVNRAGGEFTASTGW